jgi:hypothetical protein
MENGLSGVVETYSCTVTWTGISSTQGWVTVFKVQPSNFISFYYSQKYERSSGVMVAHLHSVVCGVPGIMQETSVQLRVGSHFYLFAFVLWINSDTQFIELES